MQHTSFRCHRSIATVFESMAIIILVLQQAYFIVGSSQPREKIRNKRITFTRMIKSSMVKLFSEMVIIILVISLTLFLMDKVKIRGCMYVCMCVGDWFRGKTMGKGMFCWP